jgi:hypothetical protein
MFHDQGVIAAGKSKYSGRRMLGGFFCLLQPPVLFLVLYGFEVKQVPW